MLFQFLIIFIEENHWVLGSALGKVILCKSYFRSKLYDDYGFNKIKA